MVPLKGPRQQEGRTEEYLPTLLPSGTCRAYDVSVDTQKERDRKRLHPSVTNGFSM